MNNKAKIKINNIDTSSIIDFGKSEKKLRENMLFEDFCVFDKNYF